MTRKIRSAIENSSAIHKAMLKGSQIGPETNKGDIFGNQNKGSSLMSNHIKCDFENVLKENKNKTAKLHSLKPNKNMAKLKSNVKKPSNELHDKKWCKNGRQKYSKTIKPYRLIKLPYGCVWNGEEGRFAIRVFSPKLKNELIYSSSQDATEAGRIRSQVENELIGNGYGKSKFENVCKENLNNDNENIKLKNLLNYENGVMKSENELQHEENDLCDKIYYKNVEGITEIIHPRRIVNLPYGCIWNGKEGRFAVRVVSPKVKNVKMKRADESGSLHTVASLSTNISYR